jgi:hypothetical protein
MTLLTFQVLVPSKRPAHPTPLKERPKNNAGGGGVCRFE